MIVLNLRAMIAPVSGKSVELRGWLIYGGGDWPPWR
jgi:hypothetical protein